jgi:hypothetical protein
MKKYKVTLEYRICDTFEIEAESERDAESQAMEQISVGPLAEHMDTKITEVKEPR